MNATKLTLSSACFRSPTHLARPLLLGGLLLAPGSLTAQELAHRWSFDDTSDSAGEAAVTLHGTAAIADGQLVLSGGGTRSNHASIPIGTTLAASTSLTVETWFTITTDDQTWSKVWMFGTPGASGTLSTYMDFTPRSGVADNPPSASFKPSGGEVTTRATPNPAALPTGVEILATVVYDAAGDEIRLYLDGVLADSGPWTGSISELGTTAQNFIGAAVFYPDPDWAGSVNEMRIWNGAMGSAQVEANANAGPNAIAERDPYLSMADSIFERANDTVTLDIPISNLGTANDLSIDSATLEGLDSGNFTITGGLPLVIGPGETANLTVDFDPDNFSGSFLTNLILETNDPFTPQRIVALEVEVALPDISLPTSLALGPVANDAPAQTYSVVVTNDGTGDLEIYDASFGVGPLAPTHFQRFAIVHDFINDDILTIPGGESVDLEFTFDPSGLREGTKIGFLQLSTNDVDGQTSVNVAVEVTAPAEPGGPPELVHRWSFDDASDSAGEAEIILHGTASIAGGELVLAGGGTRENHAEIPIGETLEGASSLSVETWFTASAPEQTWSKVWMFGTSGPGPVESVYLDFTPYSGVDGNPPSASFRSRSGEITTRADPNPPPLTAGNRYHSVVVYDALSDQISLYLDGVLLDSSLWTGAIHELGITTDNFIGAAVHFGDTDWAGSVDEMRIWTGALTAGDAAASFAAGPAEVIEPGTGSEGGSLHVTGVEISDGNLVITGAVGLVSGEEYHLETGTTLEDFAPVSGSTFSAGEPIPQVPAVGPRRFVRIVAGPEPAG